jgi:hypothetical protein
LAAGAAWVAAAGELDVVVVVLEVAAFAIAAPPIAAAPTAAPVVSIDLMFLISSPWVLVRG